MKILLLFDGTVSVLICEFLIMFLPPICWMHWWFLLESVVGIFYFSCLPMNLDADNWKKTTALLREKFAKLLAAGLMEQTFTALIFWQGLCVSTTDCYGCSTSRNGNWTCFACLWMSRLLVCRLIAGGFRLWIALVCDSSNCIRAFWAQAFWHLVQCPHHCQPSGFTHFLRSYCWNTIWSWSTEAEGT